MKIVDEFTGRILEGRRWSEGLHQAVEAKEGVKIKEENQTLATITLQNYFRLYDKLAGMTGTAVTEAAELASTYDLQVVPIPTHRPTGPPRPGRPHLQDRGRQVRRRRRRPRRALRDRPAGARRHHLGREVREAVAGCSRSGASPTRCSTPSSTPVRPRSSPRPAGSHAVTVATNMAGRGVDILLGGNPEGLADRDVRGRGPRPRDRRGPGPLRASCSPSTRPSAEAEGDKVRELGGLYVLGTERHESRRIDNQLRGRSGRQGDPGESRFYLSLEDELMRLFATGAMNWVMGKALPDDVPIEAKMVTKAIERAQNTVEQRNAEIRKNVLKYDEVMNEQRKVIYKRRDQILDGADLRDEALEYLAEAVDAHRSAPTASPTSPRSGTSRASLAEVADVLARPSSPSTSSAESTSTDELYELLMGEATGLLRAAARSELGAETMREVERQVMLQIIDQHWREHLYEMDYLQEGINLRAMGQKDPLVEWQREGFEMFGADDAGHRPGLREVRHARAGRGGRAAGPGRPSVGNVQYTGPDDPSEAPSTMAGRRPGRRPQLEGRRGRRREAVEEPVVNTPVVKSEWDKTPRNAPCPCGSGKKFKLCHGALSGDGRRPDA